MIGKTVGKYQIIDKIGEGGMGTVYKAEDTTLHRPVALKTLSPHLAEDEDARRRFVREAEAASSLNHPNITTIYELLEDEGHHHICMEYVEGRTIREMVEGGRVSVKRAVDIIIQAAEALGAAHDRGILHRDIKSANIMVTEDGRVKVMDFGLAHLEDKSQLTRTGTTMGTLSYSSPETVSGKPASASSEIFSLGIVFHELLTGQLPFQGTSEAEIVLAIISGKQPSITEFRGDVSDNLEAVVFRMLEKKPEQRYQNCGGLISDLKAIRSTLETTTVGRPVVLPALRAKRRRKLAIGLGAAVIAAGAAIILLTGAGGSRLDPNMVVVADFRNETRDESLESIGSWMAAHLVNCIGQTNLLETVTPDRSSLASRIWFQRALNGETTDPVKELAEETFAGIAVSGEYYLIDDNTVEIHARIRDIRRGRLLEDLPPIRGPATNWLDLAEDLRQQVLGTLAVKCNPAFAPFVYEVSQPQSYDAWVQFNTGLRTYFGQTGFSPDQRRIQAIPYFLRAFDIDSTYVSALIWAARMAIFYGDSNDTAGIQMADSLITLADSYRDRMTPFERLQLDAITHGFTGDLVSRFGSLRRIVERNPGTFWTFDAAQFGGMAGYPREALEYFDMIDPYGNTIQAPGWWYEQRTYALAFAGEYKELIKHIETARRELGYRIFRPPELGQALAALGRRNKIFDWLEDTELTPGTFVVTALRIAERLKYHGHLTTFEEFIRWFEERFESFPAETKATPRWRNYRAQILILTGRFEEAYEIGKALNAENPLQYNLAVGVPAAVIGDREEALLQIGRLEERYGSDNYFQKYRTMSRQAVIYAHLGDTERALRLLEESVKYGSGLWAVNNLLMYCEPLWDQPRFRALVSPTG